MRNGMLLLGLLVSLTSSAEVIYKWVDDTGQVHYSDVPRQGAIEIHVAPVQTFSLPSASQQSTRATAGENDDQAENYDFVDIASPAAEETIWNTGGLLTVAVDLQPGLKMGHQIVLYLDNQQVAVLPKMSSSLDLQNVERGSHKLRAEVIDENGKKLIASSTKTFYYQQTSVTRRPKITGNNTAKTPAKQVPARTR